MLRCGIAAMSHCVNALLRSTVGENMELVPIFGTDFNNFIPVLLLVFALFTLFRLVDRIVRKVGIEGFGEYVAGRPDHEERRAEGREFIRKGGLQALH